MPGAGEKRMTAEEIVKYFKVQKRLPDMSDAAAAIRTVLKFLERDQSGTVQELTEELERCRDVLCTKSDGSVASIMSGCDLVKQHMTKTDLLAFADMERGRKIMIKRGKEFLAEIEDGKARISKEASLRILDGMRILTHSRSKNVLRTLTAAHDEGKRFCVYVTQSMPDKSGSQMAKELRQHGISATEILDASVGYIMAQVDVVMVGAEGVVETGGIINKIGTYSVGLIAKSLKKPLYVLCESCKFARLYPLSQADVPMAVRHLPSTLDKEGVNLEEEHPLTDYTPPSLITYLFTDLGILVPTAVSDALLKLYL